MYVCVSESKKCLFFGNFGGLCFLETPVLRFALLPYYRRIVKENVDIFADFLCKSINATFKSSMFPNF